MKKSISGRIRKQADIMRQIRRASCVTVARNTKAKREDGCALSTLPDLLCYVQELSAQNCLYGNDWKQKENAVDTCTHGLNVMNYLKELHRLLCAKRSLGIICHMNMVGAMRMAAHLPTILTLRAGNLDNYLFMYVFCLPMVYLMTLIVPQSI
jgi:hypothetical protein